MVNIVSREHKEFTFHNQATTTGNGNRMRVDGFTQLTIEISGTSTSRTVTFYETLKDGTLIALIGVKRSDLSTATSTTTNNEKWQFDITGANEIVMDLTAVAGGNVTVYGRAVS